MTDSDVRVIVTGIDWMGGGVGSIESTLRHLFQRAQEEVLLTVYSITSSADMLFDWLDIALSRGVEVKMIVNRLNEQSPTVTNMLHNLESKYQHFHLYDFSATDWTDLHAKVVIVDRQTAIVGSSNLSRRGLVDNYELALRVTGQTVTEIANAIDCIIAKLN